MLRARCGWILCLMVALAGATARAEALKPSAARRVQDNAPAITAELRDVIASSATAQGEQLQGLVADDQADWGIRYRDGHLLFSIPVRKNLTLREKNEGEAEARKLAVNALGQKFSRLLELEDASAGLDQDAVRVVLIEPDARRAYQARLTTGGYGGGYGASGIAGSGWSGGFATGYTVGPCVPAPAPPCGCH